MMLILAVLAAVANAHAQPLETVHVVDTVDTGVLRFLIKGPCSPQILEEFNDLAIIVNRYSRHPSAYMRWNTDKWDNQPGQHALKYTLPTDASAHGYIGYYNDAMEKNIRLNHVTVAVECCDAILASVEDNSEIPGNTHAADMNTASTNHFSSLSSPNWEPTIHGYGWYPCHDLMRNMYDMNMLPNSVELYSGNMLGDADSNTVDPQTTNPNPTTNTNGPTAT